MTNNYELHNYSSRTRMAPERTAPWVDLDHEATVMQPF
jgi:hypothetical protein